MGEGHRKRLREKYLKKGIYRLEEAEILELLLFYVIPRKDTRPMAEELIERFKTIGGLLDAPVEEIEKVKGIGDSVYIFLRMLKDVSGHYNSQRSGIGRYIGLTSDMGNYVIDKYGQYEIEILIIICIDESQHIIAEEIISKGDEASVEVNFIKITDVAQRVAAEYIVLAHNHPSGLAIPSGRDVETTRILREKLSRIGITLLDHVVFEQHDFVSMRESRLFDGFDS